MPTSRPDIRGLTLAGSHGGLVGGHILAHADPALRHRPIQAQPATEERMVIQGTAVLAGVTGHFWFGAIRLAAGCWQAAAMRKRNSRTRDVMALASHDYGRPLARTANNTLDVDYNDADIRVEMRLNGADPDAQSVWAKVIRGEMTALSIGFTIIDGDWIEAVDNSLDADTDGATIDQFEATEITVHEISVVAQGAYGGAECAPVARVAGQVYGHDNIVFHRSGTFRSLAERDHQVDTLVDMGFDRTECRQVLGMTVDELLGLSDADQARVHTSLDNYMTAMSLRRDEADKPDPDVPASPAHPDALAEIRTNGLTTTIPAANIPGDDATETPASDAASAGPGGMSDAVAAGGGQTDGRAAEPDDGGNTTATAPECETEATMKDVIRDLERRGLRI